jgi:tetratricopeptide (TPR) repeat protein
MGNPKGLENTISDGIVSAIREASAIPGFRWLQITAPISHGSSGGPLLDVSGHVLGMTTWNLPGGENLNFAIPAEYIAELARPAAAWVRGHPRAPAGQALPPVVSAESAAGLARSLRKAKDYARAKATLDAALDRYPGNAVLLVQLAELNLDQQRFEQAEDVASRVIEISPDSPAGHRLLAAAFLGTGATNQARAEAVKTLESKPDAEDAAAAYLVLADCAASFTDFSTASAYLASALKYEDVAQDAVVHARYAVALSQIRKFAEADAEARVAVALDPESAYVRALLTPLGLPRGARIVSKLDEWDASQRYFVKGVVTNEGSAPLEQVRVVAEVHDPKGLLIGTGQGYAEPKRLGPGESGSFRIQVIGAFNAGSTLPEPPPEEYPNLEKILGPRPKVTAPVLEGRSLSSYASAVLHQKQVADQEDWDLKAAEIKRKWQNRQRTRPIPATTGNTYSVYIAHD